MKKLFTIAAVMLFCACFAVVQTFGTVQLSSTTQQAGADQVLKPMLEFANADSAKIAWTSKQGADLDLHYSTDRNNLNQAAVGAVEDEPVLPPTPVAVAPVAVAPAAAIVGGPTGPTDH